MFYNLGASQHANTSLKLIFFLYAETIITTMCSQYNNHARIQEFLSGGGGGAGQTGKKSPDNVFFFFFFFFLVLSLFYRSKMVNFKEIYHFSRFQRGPTFSRGGGGSNFFQGGGGGPIPYSL